MGPSSVGPYTSGMAHAVRVRGSNDANNMKAVRTGGGVGGFCIFLGGKMKIRVSKEDLVRELQIAEANKGGMEKSKNYENC